MKARRDHAPWLLTLCFLLPLVAMSTLYVRHPVSAAVPPPSRVGMYSVSDSDGDGEALREHWADPDDIREQRLQLGGMLVLFAGWGAAAVRRQSVRRRSSHAKP